MDRTGDRLNTRGNRGNSKFGGSRQTTTNFFVAKELMADGILMHLCICNSYLESLQYSCTLFVCNQRNTTGDDGLRHVAPIGEAGCGTGGHSGARDTSGRKAR